MPKEDLGIEKAQVMFKLARKNNWGEKYDRLEHFKRFQKLQKILKDLLDQEWILIYKKTSYTGIALNPHYKQEIVLFIEEKIPYVKGMI